MAIRLIVLLIMVVVTGCGRQAASPEPTPMEYPESQTVEHVDTYHGVDVADPYRWLEDDVRESPDVKSWVDAQNEVAFAYLKAIPERDVIEKRMTELWDFERYSAPNKEGGRYYYSYNNGLQNQSIVFVQSSLDDEAKLLIDPNTWSEDGTVAMGSYYPSPDGKNVAYMVQDGGSDWRVANVVDVESGDVLEDKREGLKFTGLSWARDGSGFYYSRYPEAEEGEKFQALNMNQSVFFHRIGDAQSEDELIYARPDAPDWGFGGELCTPTSA